eukprot:3048031-Amphidinium_carterae.1
MYQRYLNKDPELEFDMDGPRADQPLRFNINVGKSIDYVNSVNLSKTLEQSRKEKTENEEQLRKDVISNHETAFGSAANEL